MPTLSVLSAWFNNGIEWEEQVKDHMLVKKVKVLIPCFIILISGFGFP